MIAICTTRFNTQQFHVLPRQGTYAFFTDLGTNSLMVLTETWISALLGRYAVWNGSFYIDVSAQGIGPIFKGRAVQERRSLLHHGGILKWKKETFRILWTLKAYFPLNKGPDTSLCPEPGYSISHCPVLLL
jgi:hypothetical protein